MRKFWLVVMLAFGAGTIASSSTAFAATKEEIAADKEKMKEAKSRFKDVSKLADKWAKAHEKDKDKADIDAELVTFYKEDIQRIRDAGIEVRPADDEAAPPGTVSGGGNKPDLEPAKLEELRDLVVPLKDGETKGDDKAKALKKYAGILEERYNRRVEMYEESKAAKE